MRLLKSKDGWWCLARGGVAHLPNEAATCPATPSAKPILVPEAHQMLDRAGIFKTPQHDTYSLTVLTSTACNLGCGYCFQNVFAPSEGQFDPERIPRIRLTGSVINGIFDFVRDMMGRSNLAKLKLLLFGGEPLLNADACIRLLRLGAQHGLIHGEMISNGALLTPKLASDLEAKGLRKVQITFDGDQERHDSIRATRNGSPTFKKILRNVADATDTTDLRWQLRLNVSHRNEYSVEQLIDLLAERVRPDRTTVYTALINDVGIGYRNEIRYTDAFIAEYISWQVRILDRGFSLPIPRADRFCGFCSVTSGKIGAVVNADGALYSCWETAGRVGLEVGHVTDGYLPEERIADRWHMCGYSSIPRGDQSDEVRFNDIVDGAILDAMRQRGMLARTR